MKAMTFGALAMLVIISGPATASRAADRDGRAWPGKMDALTAALERGDVSAAVYGWQAAHAAALESRDWESMLRVGEAVVRIGQVARTSAASAAQARDAYVTALYRARRQDSLEGVLRVLEAAAAIGDRVLVGSATAVADAMIPRLADGPARMEARARVARVRGDLRAQEHPDAEP